MKNKDNLNSGLLLWYFYSYSINNGIVLHADSIVYTTHCED